MTAVEMPKWPAKVEALIQRNFRAPRGRKLMRETALRGDDGLGGFDLDVIQLVMDLEDEFDVEITDAEDESLFTVGEVFDLMARKLGVSA